MLHVIPADVERRASFLPAIYHAADRAATTRRRRHMRLAATNLVLALSLSVVAAVTVGSDDVRRIQSLLIAGAFGLSLVLSLAMSVSKEDRSWLRSRTLAESIKSSAWRFAMSAHPYDAMSVEEAEAKLRAQLARPSKKALASSALPADGHRLFTDAMIALRQATFGVRRDRYVAERIAEQQDWFTGRAVAARRAGRAWETVLFSAQAAGFLWSLAAVWSPRESVNGRVIFSAFAAASLGWLRATQHREAATTYAAMSEMLRASGESARRADSEDALAAIVVETETALERENGAWMERRSVA